MSRVARIDRFTNALWTRLWKDIAAAGVFTRPPSGELTTEEEIAALPRAARAYLKFFRVEPWVPKHWSLRLAWTGRFRLGPERPFWPIDAVQYDLRAPVTRLFHMKARMGGVLPVLARDTYVDGRGQMLAKLAGIVTVARGRGREFDESELVTWLNDAVLFAPSMLLGPNTRWSGVDDRAFDLTLTDRDCTVHARVILDDRGAPIDFETSDRYVADPFDSKHRLVRARWSTPTTAWGQIDGHPFPLRGRATWHLPSGDFTYAEFDAVPEALAFDVPPSRTSLPTARAA